MAGFNGSYAEVISTNSEDRVSAMWSFILNQAFPEAQGYVLSPQYRNTKGYTDITMSEYRPDQNGRLRKKSFLVLQAKKAGGEYGMAGWRAGEGQLERYLRALARTARNVHLYGAIAVGRWVKFYRYNRISRQATLLRNQRRMYHVRDDANKIRETLAYMEQNH